MKATRDQIIEAFTTFITRVSNDKHATSKEIAALPEVARVLLDYMNFIPRG